MKPEVEHYTAREIPDDVKIKIQKRILDACMKDKSHTEMLAERRGSKTFL